MQILIFIKALSLRFILIVAGVSNLLASLGHTGRRVVLGHTLNTLGHVITKNSHNVLNKFTGL